VHYFSPVVGCDVTVLPELIVHVEHS
jgi:hypothetical protein